MLGYTLQHLCLLQTECRLLIEIIKYNSLSIKSLETQRLSPHTLDYKNHSTIIMQMFIYHTTANNITSRHHTNPMWKGQRRMFNVPTTLLWYTGFLSSGLDQKDPAIQLAERSLSILHNRDSICQQLDWQLTLHLLRNPDTNYKTNFDQGIIVSKEAGNFAKESQLAKLFRKLKYHKKVYWFFSYVCNAKFSVF